MYKNIIEPFTYNKKDIASNEGKKILLNYLYYITDKKKKLYGGSDTDDDPMKSVDNSDNLHHEWPKPLPINWNLDHLDSDFFIEHLIKGKQEQHNEHADNYMCDRDIAHDFEGKNGIEDEGKNFFCDIRHPYSWMKGPDKIFYTPEKEKDKSRLSKKDEERLQNYQYIKDEKIKLYFTNKKVSAYKISKQNSDPKVIYPVGQNDCFMNARSFNKNADKKEDFCKAWNDKDLNLPTDSILGSQFPFITTDSISGAGKWHRINTSWPNLFDSAQSENKVNELPGKESTHHLLFNNIHNILSDEDQITNFEVFINIKWQQILIFTWYTKFGFHEDSMIKGQKVNTLYPKGGTIEEVWEEIQQKNIIQKYRFYKHDKLTSQKHIFYFYLAINILRCLVIKISYDGKNDNAKIIAEAVFEKDSEKNRLIYFKKFPNPIYELFKGFLVKHNNDLTHKIDNLKQKKGSKDEQKDLETLQNTIKFELPVSQRQVCKAFLSKTDFIATSREKKKKTAAEGVEKGKSGKNKNEKKDKIDTLDIIAEKMNYFIEHIFKDSALLGVPFDQNELQKNITMYNGLLLKYSMGDTTYIISAIFDELIFEDKYSYVRTFDYMLAKRLYIYNIKFLCEIKTSSEMYSDLKDNLPMKAKDDNKELAFFYNIDKNITSFYEAITEINGMNKDFESDLNFLNNNPLGMKVKVFLNKLIETNSANIMNIGNVKLRSFISEQLTDFVYEEIKSTFVDMIPIVEPIIEGIDKHINEIRKELSELPDTPENQAKALQIIKLLEWNWKWRFKMLFQDTDTDMTTFIEQLQKIINYISNLEIKYKSINGKDFPEIENIKKFINKKKEMLNSIIKIILTKFKDIPDSANIFIAPANKWIDLITTQFWPTGNIFDIINLLKHLSEDKYKYFKNLHIKNMYDSENYKVFKNIRDNKINIEKLINLFKFLYDESVIDLSSTFFNLEDMRRFRKQLAKNDKEYTDLIDQKKIVKEEEKPYKVTDEDEEEAEAKIELESRMLLVVKNFIYYLKKLYDSRIIKKIETEPVIVMKRAKQSQYNNVIGMHKQLHNFEWGKESPSLERKLKNHEGDDLPSPEYSIQISNLFTLYNKITEYLDFFVNISEKKKEDGVINKLFISIKNILKNYFIQLNKCKELNTRIECWPKPSLSRVSSGNVDFTKQEKYKHLQLGTYQEYSIGPHNFKLEYDSSKEYWENIQFNTIEYIEIHDNLISMFLKNIKTLIEETLNENRVGFMAYEKFSNEFKSLQKKFYEFYDNWKNEIETDEVESEMFKSVKKWYNESPFIVMHGGNDEVDARVHEILKKAVIECIDLPEMEKTLSLPNVDWVPLVRRLNDKSLKNNDYSDDEEIQSAIEFAELLRIDLRTGTDHHQKKLFAKFNPVPHSDEAKKQVKSFLKKALMKITARKANEKYNNESIHYLASALRGKSCDKNKEVEFAIEYAVLIQRGDVGAKQRLLYEFDFREFEDAINTDSLSIYKFDNETITKYYSQLIKNYIKNLKNGNENFTVTSRNTILCIIYKYRIELTQGYNIYSEPESYSYDLGEYVIDIARSVGLLESQCSKCSWISYSSECPLCSDVQPPSSTDMQYDNILEGLNNKYNELSVSKMHRFGTFPATASDALGNYTFKQHFSIIIDKILSSIHTTNPKTMIAEQKHQFIRDKLNSAISMFVPELNGDASELHLKCNFIKLEEMEENNLDPFHFYMHMHTKALNEVLIVIMTLLQKLRGKMTDDMFMNAEIDNIIGMLTSYEWNEEKRKINNAYDKAYNNSDNGRKSENIAEYFCVLIFLEKRKLQIKKKFDELCTEIKNLFLWGEYSIEEINKAKESPASSSGSTDSTNLSQDPTQVSSQGGGTVLVENKVRRNLNEFREKMNKFWEKIFNVSSENINKYFEVYFYTYIKDTNSYNLLDNYDDQLFFKMIYSFLREIYDTIKYKSESFMENNIYGCYNTNNFIDNYAKYTDNRYNAFYILYLINRRLYYIDKDFYLSKMVNMSSRREKKIDNLIKNLNNLKSEDNYEDELISGITDKVVFLYNDLSKILEEYIYIIEFIDFNTLQSNWETDLSDLIRSNEEVLARQRSVSEKERARTDEEVDYGVLGRQTSLEKRKTTANESKDLKRAKSQDDMRKKANADRKRAEKINAILVLPDSEIQQMSAIFLKYFNQQNIP